MLQAFFWVACCGIFCFQGLCYYSRPGAEHFPVHPGQWLLLQFMHVLLHVDIVLLCLVFGVS